MASFSVIFVKLVTVCLLGFAIAAHSDAARASPYGSVNIDTKQGILGLGIPPFFPNPYPYSGPGAVSGGYPYYGQPSVPPFYTYPQGGLGGYPGGIPYPQPIYQPGLPQPTLPYPSPATVDGASAASVGVSTKAHP